MEAQHHLTNQEIIAGFRAIIDRWIAELREETRPHDQPTAGHHDQP